MLILDSERSSAYTGAYVSVISDVTAMITVLHKPYNLHCIVYSGSVMLLLVRTSISYDDMMPAWTGVSANGLSSVYV
jgi:hypothetical protein